MTGKSQNTVHITPKMMEQLRAEITPEFLAKFDSMTDADIAEQIAKNPDAAPELDDKWFEKARLVRPLKPAAE
jgi:hypothetical protein